jgi:hypothetical protein
MNEDDLVLFFPDGQNCLVEITAFNSGKIEIKCEEIDYYKKIKIEPIEIYFDCKLINCDIKALKKLFRIKYPRKIKKKIFGTRRQRNKLFK